MRNYYVSGKWNTICQRCGFKFKSNELKLEWTGLRVCDGCWETRHPQTLIQIPEDDPSVPWAAPESTDVFVALPEAILLESSTDPTSPSTWILTEAGTGLFTET